MNATDLNEILQELALQRPVFHSEADFQYALAWAMHVKFPTSNVRLEIPIDGFHVDAIFRGEGLNEAFELKYKTKGGLYAGPSGELFHLKQHSAQDLGRYDFLKDVIRLEGFVQSRAVEQGWAVLLTNDQGYWIPGRTGTVDAAFRIHQGVVLQRTVQWDQRAGEGTTRGRQHPLIFSGNYELQWNTFSRAAEIQRNVKGDFTKIEREFKYLLVHVGRSTSTQI